jgi:hypothetical protein
MPVSEYRCDVYRNALQVVGTLGKRGGISARHPATANFGVSSREVAAVLGGALKRMAKYLRKRGMLEAGVLRAGE